jgi:hypothetical protein
LPKTLENFTVYCDKYPLSSSLAQFFSLLKKHCPGLKTITIPGTVYEPQSIVDGLKTLTSLEKITAELTDLTDGHVSALTTLVHLKTLEVKSTWNNHLTNASFVSFAKFKELEKLVLTGLVNVTAEGIDALSTLLHFRSLTIETQGLNNNGLNAIAKLRHLQMLDLGDSRFREEIRPETMNALGSLPELHTLCIPVRTNMPFFKHASSFVKVQKLKLKTFFAVEDDELVSLQEMPELTELEITRCGRLTDQALTKLSDCRKLKKVTLTESNFTPTAIANFKLARPDIEIIN